MPRHPDPDLEDRILRAAHVLWKRGGEESLTMRALARAAGTNTPAVYRRFKDREDVIRALIRRIQDDIRKHLQAGETLEDIAEAYAEYALHHPHEYDLFYAHVHQISPRKGLGRPPAIGESRPNFAFVQHRLAKELGGSPEDHTQLALALWATLHGTTMLLLSKSIPEGHEGALRSACRQAVKVLIEGASEFPENNRPKRGRARAARS